jgi:YidC/Oxa1 family membrane protein insertase
MPDPMDWSSGYILQWNSGLRGTELNIADELRYYEAFALQGDELLKTKEKGTGLREGQTDWMAIRTKYFMMAVQAEEGAKAASLEGIKTSVMHEGQSKNWKQFTTQMVATSLGSRQRTDHYTLYIGPIDYRRLKAGNAGLEKVMSFGWTIIKPFSIAFMYTLEFLYRVVGNYGWAIIIFSILIKAVLFPLTRKSYQSMRAMQELQPKIADLKKQKQYKDNPQALNQATMKLYKEHGVNPMGGCLPLLLQMPVLFALFNLFRTTIMLRQSSFLLISDLSAPDAILPIAGGINLLPILMGGTMLIQQKLATQNPQQKMMAYIMPIFLAVIFYRLSAGLNLYYLMFNILTIAQELLIKRHK